MLHKSEEAGSNMGSVNIKLRVRLSQPFQKTLNIVDVDQLPLGEIRAFVPEFSLKGKIMKVFVLNHEGKPLMPTKTSEGKKNF